MHVRHRGKARLLDPREDARVEACALRRHRRNGREDGGEHDDGGEPEPSHSSSITSRAARFPERTAPSM
jgi:hypothetical protein